MKMIALFAENRARSNRLPYAAGITVLCFFFLAVMILCEAHASRPVERTLTGCVVGGVFYSVSPDEEGSTPEKAYRIRVRTPIDLSVYEGKTIAMTGFLYPGDRFTLRNGAKPEVKSKSCRNEYRKVIGREYVMGYVVGAHRAATKGDFKEAYRLIAKAIEIDGGDCQTYIDRAAIHYLRGDFRSGRHDVEYVMSRACPDRSRLNFLVLGDIAKILAKAGKHGEAEEVYRLALDTCRTDICRKSVQRDMEGLGAPGK